MSTMNTETRRRLESDVHKALMLWHKDDAAGSPLAGLNSVQRGQQVDGSSIRQATNQVLLSALAILRMSHERDETLVVKRFVENKPSFAVANELNVAESTLYKMQRQAIRRLAEILAEGEEDDQQGRLADFEARVPPRTYDRVIGVDSQVDRLCEALLAPEPPWLIVLTGLGGIGKTALAHAVVKRLILEEMQFADFAWVSAQQQVFDPSGFIRMVERPALTTFDLTEQLALQLLPASARPTPFSANEALRSLQAAMRQSPCLVVIDNLETVTDLRELAPLLRRLAGPSKFLLTSRETLHSEPDIRHVTVPELSKPDALRLLRHEASRRSLSDVAAADSEALSPIVEAVGGNPLALKLVVGQLHYLPLERVLRNLREAQGKKAGDLYRYIYWNSWAQLSPEAQSVFLLMPLFASGVELSHIERLSDVKDGDLLDALEHLVRLSLVDVSGDFRSRRYGIHRLTETFLLQEVIKWT